MPFETFDSVFDALAATLAESPGMKARFELMSALQVQIQRWGLPPAAAAVRLGISGPRLAALVRGRLGKFSLDALVKLTGAARDAGPGSAQCASASGAAALARTARGGRRSKKTQGADSTPTRNSAQNASM